jgi:hypothetical protein
MLNQAIVAQELYHNAVAGSSDPYKSYREGMVLRRELLNRLWFYRLGDRQQELFTPPAGKGQKAAPRLAPKGVKGEWNDLREFGEFSPVLSTLQVVLLLLPLSLYGSSARRLV